MARRWTACVALCVLLASATAHAYELRAIPLDQTGFVPPVGYTFRYDIFLDTQGQSEISWFSVSMRFDTGVG